MPSERMIDVLVKLSVAVFLAAAACVPVAACEGSKPKLPPLKLNPEHQNLLKQVGTASRPALDYYISLPAAFFRGFDSSTKRRVWYIDSKSMTDEYLKAGFGFECNGGSFEVEMRLFQSPVGPLIALNSGSSTIIVEGGKPGDKRPRIQVITLKFFKVADGAWKEVEGAVLPAVDADAVLLRYYDQFRAHLNMPDQPKSILLEYELSRSTTDIALTGRENFMNPFGRYVWDQYRWDGVRFQSIATDIPLAKISVLRSGQVMLNGRPAGLATIEAEYRRLQRIAWGIVWYYREDSQPPRIGADKAFDAAMKHHLPVSVSSKPDFSDYIDGSGVSRPRQP